MQCDDAATREAIASKKMVGFGLQRLTALCEPFCQSTDRAPLLSAFHRLVHPWGDRKLGKQPLYASNIADDNAPFEFCVALGDELPEVQFYVEPQGDPPSLLSNMARGRAQLDLV